MHGNPELYRYLRGVCSSPEDAEVLYHLPDPGVLHALADRVKAGTGVGALLPGWPAGPGAPIAPRLLEAVYRALLRYAQAAHRGVFRDGLSAGDVLAGIMRRCARRPRVTEATPPADALRRTGLGRALLG